MAKKKLAVSDQQVVVGNQPGLDTPLSTSAARAAEEIGYTVGQWAWRNQYICKQCQFDSLDLDVMLQHLLLVHSIVALKEPEPALSSPQPSPEGRGSEIEKADGIFEIDLKEDQDGTTNIN